MVTVVRWECLCMLMECNLPLERAFQGFVEAPAQKHILTQTHSIQPASISWKSTEELLLKLSQREQEQGWTPELIDFRQKKTPKASLSHFHSTLQESTGLLIQDPPCPGALCLRTPGNTCCRSFITAAKENRVRREAVKGYFQDWWNPLGKLRLPPDSVLQTVGYTVSVTCLKPQILLQEQFQSSTRQDKGKWL